MIVKDIVLTSLDEVIDHLQHDTDCSQYLMDWILNRIDEIEDRFNNFVLIREEQGLGYILDEFDNFEDEPIQTSTFWFEDFNN